MKAPPFRQGIRVTRQFCVSGVPLWQIAARRGVSGVVGFEQAAVDYRGEPDAPELESALAVLNDKIKGWPMHPVTAKQVRAFDPTMRHWSIEVAA